MHEGILSLMQMGKVAAALARFDQAGGLFISVLTNPTMGGVAGQVVGLLTAMGYKRPEAEQAVGALKTEDKTTEELLREALRSMG